MSPDRTVIDTGIFISSLLRPNSVPAKVANFIFTSAVLFVSQRLLAEVTEVARRPKFASLIDEEDLQDLLNVLHDAGEMVALDQHVRACRDPDDDHILSLAVNGRATWIVSGDKDLLALDPFRGIRIVSPADYLALASRPA